MPDMIGELKAHSDRHEGCGRRCAKLAEGEGIRAKSRRAQRVARCLTTAHAGQLSAAKLAEGALGLAFTRVNLSAVEPS